jgi:hypothetical protein
VNNFQSLYIECLNNIYNKLDTNTIVNTNTATNTAINDSNDNGNITSGGFISKIKLLFTTYYDNKTWLPSQELINEDNYDDFCDFVKWKKTSLTYIHAFSKFINNTWLDNEVYELLINKFIESIKHFLSQIPEGCKVTDALLEQVLVIIEYTSPLQDKVFVEYISLLNNDINNYRPSTRFKIYDIKEYLNNKTTRFNEVCGEKT